MSEEERIALEGAFYDGYSEAQQALQKLRREIETNNARLRAVLKSILSNLGDCECPQCAKLRKIAHDAGL